MKSFKSFVQIILITLSLPLLFSCGPKAMEKKIVVGSKIDTEGSLLGNLILLSLEQHGFTVEDKIQTGTTPVVRAAIAAGEIDIYPEYTGNAAFW